MYGLVDRCSLFRNRWCVLKERKCSRWVSNPQPLGKRKKGDRSATALDGACLQVSTVESHGLRGVVPLSQPSYTITLLEKLCPISTYIWQIAKSFVLDSCAQENPKWLYTVPLIVRRVYFTPSCHHYALETTAYNQVHGYNN